MLLLNRGNYNLLVSRRWLRRDGYFFSLSFLDLDMSLHGAVPAAASASQAGRLYFTSVREVRSQEGKTELFDPARFERSIRAAFVAAGIAGERNEPMVLHVVDEAIAKLSLLSTGMPDAQELRQLAHAALVDTNLPMVAAAYLRQTTADVDPGRSFGVALTEAQKSGRRVGPPLASRRRLPNERQSITHKFQVGSHKGYVTVGLYEDGSPGEIFVSMSKEGSTMSGLLDSLATSVSIGLQHGVPLRTVVDKFSHVHFDPSGFTENPNIRYAKSVVDYIFRWLGQKFPEAMSRQEVLDADTVELVPRSEMAPDVKPDSPLAGACPMLTPRKVYKPFEYPAYFELFTKQNQAHWLPLEVNMEADITDYKHKLSPAEMAVITNILRFFTQGDIEVNNNYNSQLIPHFPKPEIRMMLSSFAAMEGIHIWAYSYLNDTLGLPDTEYSAFLNIQAMREKYEYVQNFNVRTVEDLAINMAVFGGFMEGVSLFSSFAILMHFPRMGRLKGVGQIITWSIRDETLHSDGICRLFRDLISENRHLWTPELQKTLYSACQDMVTLEDAFIDACFSLGDIPGLKGEDVKQYIRYIADRRLHNLGLDALYGAAKNPLPWLDAMINAKEHTNFFENRATEYAKGGVINDWT